jgi:mono/diheme cytochrome c family protein
MPRLPVLTPLAALVALAAAVSGCGSGQTRGAPEGHALFQQACGACHTLTGHNDPRHQGGDLLGFHSTRTQMLQLVSEMPVRHPLNRAELDAVVRYVMALEAGHR